MLLVVPAIIPKNFDDLKEKADQVKDYVSLVQVDVMDGKFAPEPSWPYIEGHHEHFKNLATRTEPLPFFSDLNFEVDMMVENPEVHIEDWINIGAAALVIHIGSTEKIGDIIKRCRDEEVGIGLALRPETPNEEIEKWIPQIDFVQFMGNQKIGYHGVELDRNVLGKIKDLRKTYPGLIIGVDIGVNFETAPDLVAAGANKLVSGSAIFKSDDIEMAINMLAHAGE